MTPRWNYLPWALGCAVMASLVKKVMRPGASDLAVTLLLGWAPSLLYACGLVLVVLAFTPRGREAAYAASAGIGAFLYECLQPAISGRTFDVADLVATGVGALAGYGLHLRDRPRAAPAGL